MIESTEIARGVYRIGIWDDPCLAGVSFPQTSYNMFLVAEDKPAIINTMFRRCFARLRAKVAEIIDPASLRYGGADHEGDSSGAVNEWLATAPQAVAVCSELCAVLSLRDFAEKEPLAVTDGQVIDFGSHRLRFLITPLVNLWDSLMVYEETTGVLFLMPGVEISTDRDLVLFADRSLSHSGYCDCVAAVASMAIGL
jgi:flavorubredoxin